MPRIPRHRALILPALCLLPLLTLLAACSPGPGHAPDAFEEALRRLDRHVDSAATFRTAHERRLRELHGQLGESLHADDSLRLLTRLVRAYSFYQSDTALALADRAIALARRRGQHEREVTLAAQKATVLGMAGLPWAGMHLLDSLQRVARTPAGRLSVFRAYFDVDDYFYAYSLPDDLAADDIARMAPLADSLRTYETAAGDRYLRLNKKDRSMEQNMAELKQEMARHTDESSLGTYAIIISNLAQRMNDRATRDLYWVLSAIHYIRAARMDNEALIRLAQLMAREGQWRRAERYAALASQQADLYRARSRRLELSPLWQQIHAHDRSVRRRLVPALAALSLALVALASAALLLLLRHRRTRAARQADAAARTRERRALEGENGQLRAALERLSEGNTRFLAIGIDAIFELGHLRQLSLGRLKAKDGEGLMRLLQGHTAQTAGSQKKLLQRFDIAFSHIYPDWCHRVNRLLRPDSRIEAPDSELLNNEMRLLALLRLGITDCQRMATILDISVNTVYFYRNRLKNRALRRDTFEQEVMAIAEGAAPDAAEEG